MLENNDVPKETDLNRVSVGRVGLVKPLRILNLYAGIGGNRKLWGGNIEVTAVEIVPEIAAIYKDLFPQDNVIIDDAHEYLLKNYMNFDFIWSSPPCPTHSRIMTLKKAQGQSIKYPDMRLYQEIILLSKWFKGKWIIENVRSYYDPLIKPKEIGRHFYWSNFIIDIKEDRKQLVRNGYFVGRLDYKCKKINVIINNFHGYKGDKRQLINNCVESNTGLQILECAYKSEQKRLI